MQNEAPKLLVDKASPQVPHQAQRPNNAPEEESKEPQLNKQKSDKSNRVKFAPKQKPSNLCVIQEVDEPAQSILPKLGKKDKSPSKDDDEEEEEVDFKAQGSKKVSKNALKNKGKSYHPQLHEKNKSIA